MFSILIGIAGTFVQHPYIASLIFIAGLIGFTAYYAEAGLKSALVAMAATASQFFRVPHSFMRECIENFQNSTESHAAYAGTREHILHRFNQLQFLGAFVIGLLILSAGATASLIALYPQTEINAVDRLESDVRGLESDLAAADTKVSEVTAPDFERTIDAKAASLSAKERVAQAAYNSYFQSITYTGPIFDEIDTAIDSDEFLDREVQDSHFTEYFSKCSLEWVGFTPETCNEMHDQVIKLYTLKVSLLEAEKKQAEAAEEQVNVPKAIADARENQRTIKQNLADKKDELDKASLTNGRWIIPHLKVAGGIALIAFLEFLGYAWTYALLAYFVSWIAHVMRGIERKL